MQQLRCPNRRQRQPADEGINTHVWAANGVIAVVNGDGGTCLKSHRDSEPELTFIPVDQPMSIVDRIANLPLDRVESLPRLRKHLYRHRARLQLRQRRPRAIRFLQIPDAALPKVTPV